MHICVRGHDVAYGPFVVDLRGLGRLLSDDGGISSLTSIGGGSPSDMPSKTAAAPEPPSSQSSSSGGIWANFSSAFGSGEKPAQAPQKKSMR